MWVPPSIMLIILVDPLKVPVGDMFAGAILHGLVLPIIWHSDNGDTHANQP